MKTLFSVMALAGALLLALAGQGQADGGCCDKVCTRPAVCPAGTHQTSTRCKTLTDAPDIGMNSVCVQVDAGDCIGGSQNGLAVPNGCVCVAGMCESNGASGCTASAIKGCGADVITQDNDPACPTC